MRGESHNSSTLTEIGVQNNFTGTAPVPVATVRTLPRDVAAFTGRDAELRQLVAAAAGAAGAVAIHTVDGMPGVGKTALVTRAAHLLAGDFPDGQLFVDLHAHTPGMKPADPGEVLAGLLACRAWRPARSRPGWRRGWSGGAAAWPARRCCSCWTTPPGTPRSNRCCPEPPDAWC
jgi:hypothetical protein